MQTTVAQGSTLLHFARNGNFGPDGAELLVVERGEGAYVFDTARQPLRRRALEPVLRADRLLLRRGDGRGRGRAAAAARLQHELGRPPTRRRSSSPTAWPSLAPGGVDRVFFTTGGSESVEAAWKLVRQYHVANGEPQRTEGDRPRHRLPRRDARRALASPGCPAYKEPFGPPAIHTRHVSNTNALPRPDVQGEELTDAAARRDRGGDPRGGAGDGRR